MRLQRHVINLYNVSVTVSLMLSRRSSMYIRGLISRNIPELAEAIPIEQNVLIKLKDMQAGLGLCSQHTTWVISC